jgi:enhancing lycopene biosynthesis protein 2
MHGYRCGDGPGLELCTGAFLRNVLGVLPGCNCEGGAVVREGVLALRVLSRVPYLAEGDIFAPVYWLPNVIVVCEKLLAGEAV